MRVPFGSLDSREIPVLLSCVVLRSIENVHSLIMIVFVLAFSQNDERHHGYADLKFSNFQLVNGETTKQKTRRINTCSFFALGAFFSGARGLHVGGRANGC